MKDSTATRSASGSALATSRLLVDSDKSTASFTVGNLLVRTVTGTMPIVEAWVELDASGHPVAAYAALDQTRINTGNVRRDADLQKPRFLDTAAHPLLQWTASGFQETEGGGWLLVGVISGRGQTCDVTAAVHLSAASENGSQLATIRGELDRRRVGLRAPTFMIGRQVSFEVAAVLVAKKGTVT